jgi:hypothetical protein
LEIIKQLNYYELKINIFSGHGFKTFDQVTTTKEGYIAIQISSQTTKKKVSENP